MVLTINNQSVVVSSDKTLMRILREDLGLTSVKDGCSQGACGTCTILVDGKVVKSCVQKPEKFQGKEILTVEGLSPEEKEIYVDAFGKAGAVQCGFCIPGMVLCAKALLDTNPAPTREEIAFALRNNICRCTGYQKIIDAVEKVAEMLSGKSPQQETFSGKIGQPMPRIDTREKVLGTGIYTGDISFEGMIYGSAIRSAYPRAKILSIDTTKAKALSGVRAVLTADDVPGSNKIGHIKADWDTLIPVGKITHYLGDAICLIAGDTLEIVEEAKKLVTIEYEELRGVFSPEEALSHAAPWVHKSDENLPYGKRNVLKQEHLVRGNVKEALERSAHVVTETYQTPFTEHAFLEPECAVAKYDGDVVTIYSSDQGTYATQKECSEMLGFPPEKVHVINALVGGGFGGKEDMAVQHHAALLAYHCGTAVKVTLTRDESILIHPKRHPAIMTVTSACDENGILTAIKAVVMTDTGAYASLGGPVLQRACTHAAGPYNYQNVDILGTAVYTNNPPAGAFRGFGVTQTCFASECNLNLLAEKVGISPWEIRYRNAIRPGQELPNGQIAMEGTALVETLEAVKEIYEKHPRAGIACAMKNAGVGVGIPDTGRCKLLVQEGKVHIKAGASCIGQGLGTVLVQVVCETLSLSPEQVVYTVAETHNAPNSGITSGSRQTLVTGEATKRACLALKAEEKSLTELEGRTFYGEYLAKTDPMGTDVPNPVSHVAYGYATQVVLLDEVGKVEKVVAAHDIGRAINPLSVEGQIEGGVVMSLGYALTETFPLEEGKPTAKFGTLGLFRADKTPPVDSILIEKNKDNLAYGAIGVGEIVSIPTAPAVQGAYYAFDKKFRRSLPLKETAYKK
ncbi:MAG: selenium-dependent xanthine dehydrogenase [Eubacteriales bacterium]